MAWRRGEMAALRVALGALLALAAPRAPRVASLDTVGAFEAAFQGRCGEGSPCEQLCRELHDGTFECGCSPGYELHVDGYGCTQINATRPTQPPSDNQEDIIYQKDVSFSAELEIAPSNKIIYTNERHITTQPSTTTSSVPIDSLTEMSNSIDGAVRLKEKEGLSSLIQDGVSVDNLRMIGESRIELDEASPRVNVTTLGPSLEQKVPRGTEQPPWTASLDASCDCADCWQCHCADDCGKNETQRVTTPRFSGASWLALRALRGAYKRVRVRIRVRPERARGVLLLTGEHDDLTGDYMALVLRQGHVELRFDCGSGAGVLRSPEPVRLGHWNTVSVYRHSWDAWLRLNNGRRVRGRSKGLFSRMTFREPVWVGGAGNTTGLQAKLGLSEGLLGCVDFLRINGETYNLLNDAVGTAELAECAPTLAPWKPNDDVTTKKTVPEQSTTAENHAIYNINDIVHFEDNDIVMRDASAHTKNLDQNKIDNSIEQFKISNYVPKDIGKIQSPLNDMASVDEDGMDISKKYEGMQLMQMDKFGKCECQHGGGCVGGVCLCPLGYAGTRCEITLDLKVPRFNGSSYLTLPGLGNTAQSWLNIQITIKPSKGDGLILFDSDHESGRGDFFSLHLKDYFVEFSIDLGSGVSSVRSGYQLESNKWYRVSVNRAGRMVTLSVKNEDPSANGEEHKWWSRAIRARGGWRRLALHRALQLGGAPAPPSVPTPARTHGTEQPGYVGCVRQLVINDQEISIVSSALAGVNVDNCQERDDITCKDNSICKELLANAPIYPESNNTFHHAIVPKKGFKTKHRKSKLKKRAHKTKFDRSTDADDRNTDDNDRLVEGQPYDGRTYMKVKYFNEDDLDFGDISVYPSFSGKDSFIHIDDEDTMKRLVSYNVDINIRFRSWSSSGLLVWSSRSASDSDTTDFLSLGIEDSVLVFRYSLGGGSAEIAANNTRVDDGRWHRARAYRNREAGILEVDGLGSVGKVSPGSLGHLNTDNGLYIGGLPSIELSTLGRYKTGLRGCVSQLSLSGDFDIPLSLSALPHTITNNVGRCSP